MNRRLKERLTGFIIGCTAAMIMPLGMITALAGSAKISFSDPSSAVGKEFNVSVKVSATEGDLASADLVLSYDPAYLEFVEGSGASGGAGSVRLVSTSDAGSSTEFSYSLKFKAVQAGNSAISVASYEVYDADTQIVDVTKVGSSKIKVKAQSTSSKEAALSSLKVSPGTLSPAFSADVTSYTVSVGKDVDKIAVNAVAKDSKAKVSVSGNSKLKTGANSVVCKVTAEDGQTVKSYKITVNKSETAEASVQPEKVEASTQGTVLGKLTADIDGVQYGVAVSFDPSLLPAGFAQSACSYSGTQIMSGTGNDLTLIYLQTAGGAGGFFIYDETSGALSPYVTIDVIAHSVVVLPADETVTVPEGFAPTTIQLSGDHKVSGWVWESDEEQKYCVIYGMNENGDKGLYRYDIAEKTFQRYFEDPVVKSRYDEADVENLMKQYSALQKDYNTRFIIMIALIVVCLILFFIIVNMLLRKKENSYHDDDRPKKKKSSGKRSQPEQSGRIRQTPDEHPSGRRAEKRGRDSGYDRYDQDEMADGYGRREADQSRYDQSGNDQPDRNRSGASQPGASRARTNQSSGFQGRAAQNGRPQAGAAQPDSSRTRQTRPGSDRGYGEESYDPAALFQGEYVRGAYAQDRGAQSGNDRGDMYGKQAMNQQQSLDVHPAARSQNLYTDRETQRPVNVAPPMTSASTRGGRGYTVRHEDSYSDVQSPRPARQERPRMDNGMQETYRQRDLDREERTRQARERLERERWEDERRRSGRAGNPPGRNTAGYQDDDDDFEFMDLD